MKKHSASLELAGKTITFETGSLAQQATSSILARTGDTMVLVTIVAGKNREDLGYFPLSVEYVERLYAGGRIKGSRWVKREGRPSDDAVLTARLIDRSIRPLFPKEYKNEVQIVITVLSVDGENEADVLAINAVSAALHISKIPWKGPIGSVRMGYVADKETGVKGFVVNPKSSEIALAEMDLVVSQTRGLSHMVEAGALQAPEEIALESIDRAHAETAKIMDFIEAFAKECGDEKQKVEPDTALNEMAAFIEKSYKEQIAAMILARATKEGGESEGDKLIATIYEDAKIQDPEASVDKKLIAKAVEKVFFKLIRDDILKKGKRPDGRKADEIRPISGQAAVLPRVHGSAIFQRGTTQALSVATLGSPRMEQLIESAEGEESKRYIHHYSMPPYSVGETGRMGTPSRREIGHGALAERALLGVIPKQEVFPYTIRVVSEVLSSNGSTSMASTCGSTLALMDAGVPILSPVSGIAMGMVTDGEKTVILSDIIGLEDFSGDMDFKVAGTTNGMTAIQLDVKIAGLTVEQIKEIFVRAKAGRMHILERMLTVLSKPNAHVSTYAPKIEMIKIPVEKIGEVIGPGGRVIKNIIATTGAQVDVEDDGSISISGTSEEGVAKAVEWIQSLTREVTPNEEFEGEVKRILPFGAFVEILPGKEGMVHVSQMTTGFVKDPNDIVQIGQKVKVRVQEIDDQGRINLSMLFGEDANKPREQRSAPRPMAPVGHVDRPVMQPAAVAPVMPVRPASPMPAVSEHPLSLQFKRERSAVRPGGRPASRFGARRSSGPRTGGPASSTTGTRFRKTHY